MLIKIYRTGSDGYNAGRAIWTCYGPGAMGCADTPWGALADMLATWYRRGKPDAGDPTSNNGSGPDWIITAIKPDPERFGRNGGWISGVNLNRPANGYGRSIFWGCDDITNMTREPRYELAIGASIA